MPSSLRLAGVDELLDELIRLAPDLAIEAGPLERAAAAATADELRAALPMATGALRASVAVEPLGVTTSGRVATNVVVTAPHALYVEFGTARTPPRSTFVPVTRRGRQAFVRTIMDRVRDRGLVVGGDAS